MHVKEKSKKKKLKKNQCHLNLTTCLVAGKKRKGMDKGNLNFRQGVECESKVFQ